ncbi:hypothetical protein IU510_20740 [Nocardia cyriacigeorgica]|uniref:DUF6968 family protein n=1 Tax=Nocardia cyriacigeorgica TaxID=135487 RepID=UPI0018948AC4|nr:hypothetical protein [Nocardia cyriacigeorgica]MBF6100490.1 hypothetical protein [Nocardia cyriacigeorgica]MBF6320324.1 hypothetical protein [Nocardia cyriacigeorgica]MBF6346300.1 hypothetical protein [Nocardia cyriacigeorgica]MBF6534190.1 hypothetical protein [Nocardia cyriacigeorgica]
MRLREFLGSPIAVRELTKDGHPVTVEFAQPDELDGGGGYGCSIRITGLSGPARVTTIGGLDSVHALTLALAWADQVLTQEGCLWEGNPHLGFAPGSNQ